MWVLVYGIRVLRKQTGIVCVGGRLIRRHIDTGLESLLGRQVGTNREGIRLVLRTELFVGSPTGTTDTEVRSICGHTGIGSGFFVVTFDEDRPCGDPTDSLVYRHERRSHCQGTGLGFTLSRFPPT